MMNFRNRTKDVGLALLKLDKLSVQKFRKVAKSTVGGSKDSGPDDVDYEKCKNLRNNSFNIEREHVTRVATGDQDESRKEKLETIVEHPLVEAEPRVEGLDVTPKLFGTERFTSPKACRRIKSFHLSRFEALEELACKLMNVPPSQIDNKLLDMCLNARPVDFETSGKYPIVKNLECDAPGSFEDVYSTEGKDFLHLDRYTNLTPLTYRYYNLIHHASDASYEEPFKAEKIHPVHLDAELRMSFDKEKVDHDLNLHARPIRREYIAYNMMVPPPLPPNETSISSQKCDEEDVCESYYRDRTMPPYMRQHQLGRKWQEQRTAREIQMEESYRKYLSTLCDSNPYEDALKPGKGMSQHSKKQEMPLSQLLRQVRHKNRIAQEMEKKKAKFDPTRFFSKSTCFPPLDLRPKSATCPPKACPPRKKESAPKKAMPCPPPKKPPCPPPKKKGPCPARANPCDPCKPPPPCPAPKRPCGLYTGNKFKDTITLILCGFKASNISRRAISLPLLFKCSNLVKDTSVNTLSTTSVANSECQRLTTMDTSVDTSARISEKMSKKISQILKVPNLGQRQRDIEAVYFARSYEPWSPIPSWPARKIDKKQKLVCPKEGCEAPKVLPGRSCNKFPCNFKAPGRK